MRAFITRNPFTTFAVLTIGLQFCMIGVMRLIVPDGMLIRDVPLAHGIFRFRAVGPIMIAMLLTLYLDGANGLKRLFSAFTHWKVPAKWYALAMGWKFLMSYAGIFIVIAVLNHYPDYGMVMNNFFTNWTHNLFFIVGIAIVEETSWIRFSLTRMQMRYNAFTAAMIVGNVWGLWYMPMVLMNEGVPAGTPVWTFHIGILSLIILLAWVYNTTRSGLVLLVMQIVSNTAFFVVPVLPGSSKGTDFLVAYIGIFVVLAIFLVWRFGTVNLSSQPRVRWDEEDADDVSEGEVVTEKVTLRNA